MSPKENTIRSIIGERIAKASKTQPQQLDLTPVRPNVDQVDMYRTPDKKHDDGLAGPCKLIEIGEDGASDIWQYYQYMAPLRHLGPHLSNFALC